MFMNRFMDFQKEVLEGRHKLFKLTPSFSLFRQEAVHGMRQRDIVKKLGKRGTAGRVERASRDSIKVNDLGGRGHGNFLDEDLREGLLESHQHEEVTIDSWLEDNINDYISGIVMSNDELAKLENCPAILRKDHHKMVDQVKLLSGGRAGMDPLYAGFVGKGMLTGIVYGDREQYPKSMDILKVILELAYKNTAGILIIIQNSAEMIVNFGMAMERARCMNSSLKIDMVSAGDDSWPFHYKLATTCRKRGISGIVILFRVAGAMSEAARSLRDIYGTLRSLAFLNIVTITTHFKDGYAFVGSNRCGSQYRQLDANNIPAIVHEMMVYLLNYKPTRLRLEKDASVIVLINSYEKFTSLFYRVLGAVVAEFDTRNIAFSRIIYGNFLTYKNGFSITLCRDYGDFILRWLEADTSVSVWPKTNGTGRPNILQPSNPLEPTAEPFFGPSFAVHMLPNLVHFIQLVCYSLIRNEAALNSCSAVAAGSQLKKGALAILQKIDMGHIHFNRPHNLLFDLSEIVLEYVNGTTGSVIGTFLQGMAEGFCWFITKTNLSYEVWARALEEGCYRILPFFEDEFNLPTLLDGFLLVQKCVEEANYRVDLTQTFPSIKELVYQSKKQWMAYKITEPATAGLVALTIVLLELNNYLPIILYAVETSSSERREQLVAVRKLDSVVSRKYQTSDPELNNLRSKLFQRPGGAPSSDSDDSSVYSSELFDRLSSIDYTRPLKVLKEHEPQPKFDSQMIILDHASVKHEGSLVASEGSEEEFVLPEEILYDQLIQRDLTFSESIHRVGDDLRPGSESAQTPEEPYVVDHPQTFDDKEDGIHGNTYMTALTKEPAV